MLSRKFSGLQGCGGIHHFPVTRRLSFQNPSALPLAFSASYEVPTINSVLRAPSVVQLKVNPSSTLDRHAFCRENSLVGER